MSQHSPEATEAYDKLKERAWTTAKFHLMTAASLVLEDLTPDERDGISIGIDAGLTTMFEVMKEHGIMLPLDKL